MSDRDTGEGRRRRLEGVIPELLKRAVELGVEKATEAPDSLKQFVGDMKVPKEIASYLLTQVEETKNGLFRVVAKEMRDFLEHTNLAGEMKKALTTLQFEVTTTIRFSPNEGSAPPSTGDSAADPNAQATPKPEVKTNLYVKRDERPRERRRARD